jgi:hypothetical protein
MSVFYRAVTISGGIVLYYPDTGTVGPDGRSGDHSRRFPGNATEQACGVPF